MLHTDATNVKKVKLKIKLKKILKLTEGRDGTVCIEGKS